MHRHCLLLLLAVLVLLAEPLPVAAQEARVVRVGVFPLPGFNHIGEGTVSGYNMDYLEQVALSAGWILTPVVLDNWTDALRALDQGRIDLLGPALHTPDREKRYLFCRYPSGTAFTALVTLRDKTALTYEDFAAFENLRIGTAQSPFWQQNFAAYARRKAFTPPPLLIFNDMADARIAMRAGKVDAILGNAFNLLDDEKLLAKYDPAPFYYITTRQNQGLMAELNQAVAQLKLERPNLENRLARTYLARSYQTPLNREELDCIATMPPLRVGYNPDRKPLSWRDPATGEARGILPDIVRLAGRRSGLRFTFVPLTDKKKNLKNTSPPTPWIWPRALCTRIRSASLRRSAFPPHCCAAACTSMCAGARPLPRTKNLPWPCWKAGAAAAVMCAPPSPKPKYGSTPLPKTAWTLWSTAKPTPCSTRPWKSPACSPSRVTRTSPFSRNTRITKTTAWP